MLQVFKCESTKIGLYVQGLKGIWHPSIGSRISQHRVATYVQQRVLCVTTGLFAGPLSADFCDIEFILIQIKSICNWTCDRK